MKYKITYEYWNVVIRTWEKADNYTYDPWFQYSQLKMWEDTMGKCSKCIRNVRLFKVVEELKEINEKGNCDCPVSGFTVSHKPDCVFYE